MVKNCARSVCTYHCEYEGERRGETRRRDSACPWDAPGQRQTQPRPRPENALLVSPDPLQETTTTTTTRGAEKRTVAPQRRPPALVARIRGRPNAAVPARHARHEAYQHAYDSTMAQGRRRPSEGNGNTWLRRSRFFKYRFITQCDPTPGNQTTAFDKDPLDRHHAPADASIEPYRTVGAGGLQLARSDSLGGSHRPGGRRAGGPPPLRRWPHFG